MLCFLMGSASTRHQGRVKAPSGIRFLSPAFVQAGGSTSSIDIAPYNRIITDRAFIDPFGYMGWYQYRPRTPPRDSAFFFKPFLLCAIVNTDRANRNSYHTFSPDVDMHRAASLTTLRAWIHGTRSEND